MKLRHLIIEFHSGYILLVVIAVIFAICAEPANAASEPGTVTIVLGSEPISLDPGESARGDVGSVLRYNIGEPLTELNPIDSSIGPRLATAWKQIDAKTWHFFLRKGVKFHDGKDFNAEAVLFNIKRIYDTRIVSTTRGKFFDGVQLEGKAVDSHTVEIKTDKPEPLLPILMGVLTICSPNTPLDKWTRNPVGTGPYKFVKWDAGTQIVLESFDGYWGKQPQVKKVIYLWRNDSSVRAAMILIGEADLAPNISRGDANRPDMDFSYLNSETASFRIGGLWDPPLNDRRVRMALNYAIDRESIRGSILSKDVVPASQLIVPSIFGYNPELKVWPYDPQKARQLLAEARRDGVPVDKEILMIGRIGQFPGSDELVEAAMTMYRAVGLNVKLKIVEAAVHAIYGRTNSFPPGVLYLRPSTHDNNKGDAAFTAFFSFHCKGSQSNMCDKTVDDLIEKAQVATGEERRTLWRAVFKAVDEIIPQVVLFHLVSYARVGKRINFKPNIATVNEIQVAQITFT
jgi:peptide/nickel transport system substrate-binding protein